MKKISKIVLAIFTVAFNPMLASELILNVLKKKDE